MGVATSGLPSSAIRRRPPWLNPGRDGQENAHQRPQDVEERSLHVRPGRRRPQVDGIGDRRGDECAADHDPFAPGRPADEPEHTHDESEQDDVAERIREIRRDREKSAFAVVEGQFEKKRCADRADGQRHTDSVEPDAPVEARHASANEQEERDVRSGIEEEVERVGDRRRRLVGVQRPREVAQRVGGQPCSQPRPRGSLFLDENRARRDGNDGERLDGEVQPRVEERVGAGAAEAEPGVQGEDHEARDRGDLPCTHCPTEAWAELRARRGDRGTHGMRIGVPHRRHEGFVAIRPTQTVDRGSTLSAPMPIERTWS